MNVPSFMGQFHKRMAELIPTHTKKMTLVLTMEHAVFDLIAL